jgi:hypothetical protein
MIGAKCKQNAPLVFALQKVGLTFLFYKNVQTFLDTAFCLLFFCCLHFASKM